MQDLEIECNPGRNRVAANMLSRTSLSVVLKSTKLHVAFPAYLKTAPKSLRGTPRPSPWTMTMEYLIKLLQNSPELKVVNVKYNLRRHRRATGQHYCEEEESHKVLGHPARMCMAFFCPPKESFQLLRELYLETPGCWSPKYHRKLCLKKKC